MYSNTESATSAAVTVPGVTGGANEAALAAEIIEDLEMSGRSGIRLERIRGKDAYLVLEAPGRAGENEGCGEAILGAASCGILGFWYLGCQTCLD